MAVSAEAQHENQWSGHGEPKDDSPLHKRRVCVRGAKGPQREGLGIANGYFGAPSSRTQGSGPGKRAHGRAVLTNPDFFSFGVDSPYGQPPGTTNRQPLPTAANRRQPPPTFEVEKVPWP